MYRVVIVEDSDFSKKIISDIVVELGWEVVALASNGKEAFEAYSMHLPDLLIMDIVMSDYDGLVGLEFIREAHPEAKVVMCSALLNLSMIEDAILKGATDYITKPFSKEVVKKVLIKHLS